MRLLFVIMALALVLGACTAEKSGTVEKSGKSGKTGLTSFVSTDGTRKCEAWKDGSEYQAACVSTRPEMFLRAAERSKAAGGVGAYCEHGEVKDQPGFYFVRCSADESLADFIK